MSEMTGVPEGTLRYMRSKKIGPRSAKLGRRIVYRKSDVEAWVEAQFAKAVGE
ncbi:helix-turn-helix domain-containing protein [Nocardioides sp. J2M5]|nr:helix-turn-helix domain-containing protein [Nocardioides palaemonis]